MNKIIKISIYTVAIVLSLNATAKEAEGSGQITAKISTMGVGIEYNHPVNSVLSVGFGVNKFSRSDSIEKSGINYKGDVDFKSASIIANYHPWENGFRLRAGVYYNKNKISLAANSSVGALTIGDKKFTGADITLNGELSFKKVAPYIGIGYGSEPIGDNNFSFDFDIGVMKSPVKAQLTGICTVNIANACDTFFDKLAKEQADLAKSSDNFDFYPVVSLGLSYRF